MEVTLIEMADRILQRVAAPETAEIIREIHNQHGVVVRESTGLVRLTGEDTFSRRRTFGWNAPVR